MFTPVLFSNIKHEAEGARWKDLATTATYEAVKYSLLASALALIFFTAYVNPIYGVLTSISLAQSKPIEVIDLFFLAPLDGYKKKAKKVHETTKKVFEKFQAMNTVTEERMKQRVITHFDDIETCHYFPNFSRAYGATTYTQLKPLIAHIEAWKELAETAQGKIRDLQMEANDCIEKAETTATSLNESVSFLQKAAHLRKEAYEIEKNQLLPSRLHHAYFIHLLQNVEDTRSFEQMGHFLPMHYEMRSLITHGGALAADMHENAARDSFFRTTSGNSLTREEIASLPIKELASRLSS